MIRWVGGDVLFGWGAVMLGEFFDASCDLLVEDRLRPHWNQVGAIVFITMRTKDSIPSDVLERWEQEKIEWLARRGHDASRHWTDVLPLLDEKEREQFRKTFNRQREAFLDGCHGACVLRDPELARIVAASLMHFDGERYRMGDFVVMPNHVHLLAAFSNEGFMKSQCDSWLHFTATQINRKIGRKGKFWQQEPFDHLVRNVDQYQYLRDYICDNPKKAKLKPGEYYYYRYGG